MPALTDKSPARFILPAQPLRRYISAYYFLNTGPDKTEQEDCLYPEWATVRFTLQGKATGNTVGLAPLDIQPIASLAPREGPRYCAFSM